MRRRRVIEFLSGHVARYGACRRARSGSSFKGPTQIAWVSNPPCIGPRRACMYADRRARRTHIGSGARGNEVPSPLPTTVHRCCTANRVRRRLLGKSSLTTVFDSNHAASLALGPTQRLSQPCPCPPWRQAPHYVCKVPRSGRQPRLPASPIATATGPYCTRQSHRRGRGPIEKHDPWAPFAHVRLPPLAAASVRLILISVAIDPDPWERGGGVVEIGSEHYTGL